MCSILENVPCALEKKVYSSAFRWNVLKISMSSISSNVSFKICLLFNFLFWWSVHWWSGVLKSPTIIVLLSISPLCLLMFVLRIEVFLCWVHRYLQLLSFSWIDPLIIVWYPSLSLVIFILRSVLSNMRITTPAFFSFPFAWNICFHPLTFSLSASLGLKWVSGRWHIYGSCFCIHSASLCLLVGAFNPFTFKVILIYMLPLPFS